MEESKKWMANRSEELAKVRQGQGEDEKRKISIWIDGLMKDEFDATGEEGWEGVRSICNEDKFDSEEGFTEIEVYRGKFVMES